MHLPSTEFQHHQSAHCESGVTSNLLKNAKIPLSEAMAFGIGSGLFFIHVPFAKVMGIPLTSFRSFPGTIFKKTCRRLNIPYTYHNYRNPLKGAQALDQFVGQGRAVGIRSNIYWLPYIPKQFRFQFNAHNLVVYGKDQNGDYRVSDPILEETATCPSHALVKARFSKGILAPKGLIFYPAENLSAEWEENLPKAIHSGIKETVHRMLFSPVPIVGVWGIRYLGKQMQKWPRKLTDLETQKLWVANVVRMQEEIGTGGAGFRYLYAAFLQEAGQRLDNPNLIQAAKEMSAVGDHWREFATLAAKFCKDRLDTPYEEIPKHLFEISAQEKAIYKFLRRNYL